MDFNFRPRPVTFGAAPIVLTELDESGEKMKNSRLNIRFCNAAYFLLLMFGFNHGQHLAPNSFAKIHTGVFAALGEAEKQILSDVYASGVYPQLGMQIEYRTRYLTPYNEVSFGYYNNGLTIEDYLGVQIGKEIGFFRPALTLGVGIQSANTQENILGTDEFDYIRKIGIPIGFGFRTELFKRVSMEWEGRLKSWQLPSHPWWRFKIGCRIF